MTSAQHFYVGVSTVLVYNYFGTRDPCPSSKIDAAEASSSCPGFQVQADRTDRIWARAAVGVYIAIQFSQQHAEIGVDHPQPHHSHFDCHYMHALHRARRAAPEFFVWPVLERYYCYCLLLNSHHLVLCSQFSAASERCAMDALDPALPPDLAAGHDAENDDSH